MLSVTHKPFLLSVILLNIIMLSVVMLNIVMLNIVMLSDVRINYLCKKVYTTGACAINFITAIIYICNKFQ